MLLKERGEESLSLWVEQVNDLGRCLFEVLGGNMWLQGSLERHGR